MSKRIATFQSNYIPWRGYFEIDAVHESVLDDNVQLTKRERRNRNRINTPGGPIWLTIPVQVKGRFEQRVRDVGISDPHWAEKHWLSIHAHYRHAPPRTSKSATAEPPGAVFAVTDDYEECLSTTGRQTSRSRSRSAWWRRSFTINPCTVRRSGDASAGPTECARSLSMSATAWRACRAPVRWRGLALTTSCRSLRRSWSPAAEGAARNILSRAIDCRRTGANNTRGNA